MGATTHYFSAADSDGQTFTVHMERNFAFKPPQDMLICEHCGWRSRLRFLKGPLALASEHLSSAHGADRNLSHEKDETFRRAQWVIIPLSIAVLLFIFVMLT